MEKVTRIDKLTPKQEALMSEWRDKWIAKGLQTGETDWETFEANIKIAYKKANVPFPNKIIRVNSPLVGALAATIADRIFNNLSLITKIITGKKNNQTTKPDAVGGAVRDAVGGAVGDAVEDAVRDAVEDAVGGAVEGAVGGAVGDAVGGAVGGAVRDAVEDAVEDAVGGAVEGAVGGAVGDAVGGAVGGAVRDAVEDAVGGAVGDAVGGAVGGAVRDAVEDAVEDAVRDAVGEIIKSKKLQWHQWLGGQFWVGGWYWGTAFSSFFIEACNLKVSDDIMERFLSYKKINESVNYVWCNKNFVIVCARPKVINRNSQGQLHSVTTKSIEYPDGWGLYSFNGITITSELFNQLITKSYTFDQWTKEKNEEIKSLVLAFYEEKFGGEFVFRFLSKYIKEIDTYIDKKDERYLEKTTKGMNIGVYTLFKGSVNNTDIAYVRCYCPSTDRLFFLGVHPQFTHAKDAIASLCQIPAKLKDELVSISRQGEIFSFNFTEKATKMLRENKLTKDDFQETISLTGSEYFQKLKFEY